MRDTRPDPRLKVEALCRGCDPDLWFPTKGGDAKAPKRICAECPVQAECLEYALANCERFGIWGGKSENERERMRGERRRALVGAA